MEQITREEYYLAKIAGTYKGKTPEPVTSDEYYLATMAGDYSGNTPQPVTRLQYYMAKAAGVWGGSIPAPVTRLEYYWAAIANGEGEVFRPVTREEHFLALVADAYSVVQTVVTGNPALLEDVKGSRFTSLTLHGKSTQGSTTGAQLFDKSKAFAGWVKSDGSINNAGTVGKGDNIVSDYIPFEAGKQYFCGSDFVWIYNTEKGFVKKADTELKGGVFTSPDNAGFFVVAFSVSAEKALAKSNEIMINVGAVKKPYEPYTGGAPSPSPSYPQEIESAGQSGEISVKVGRTEMDKNPQVVIVPTPGGLPGIPVTSGGNYTDEKGQQWVADEIDLARGERVQWIGKYELTGKENVADFGLNPRTRMVSINIPDAYIDAGNHGYLKAVMSNKYKQDSFSNLTNNINLIARGQQNNICISIPVDIGIEDFKTDLSNQYASGRPVKVFYKLATPIRTPLPPETIAAYKTLRTYSPTTTVINDDGAGMSVGYKKAK